MMGELQSVVYEVRNLGEPSNAKEYQKSKVVQYEYMEVLFQYVPKLLCNEKFFKSAFM